MNWPAKMAALFRGHMGTDFSSATPADEARGMAGGAENPSPSLPYSSRLQGGTAIRADNQVKRDAMAMIHRLAEELQIHPGSDSGPPRSDIIPGGPEDNLSSSQQPAVAAAIQEFSSSMGEILGAIKGAFRQTQEELGAAGQYQVLAHHFEELFQNAPGGYLVTDIEANIQESNQAIAALLHREKEFLVGKQLIALVSRKDHEAFSAYFDRARLGNEAEGIKIHLQAPGGEPVPVFLAVAGRRDPEGKLVGFTWWTLNITQTRQEEKALENRVARLEACLSGLIGSFAAATEMQDPYASGHQRRVADLAAAIARELGFSPDRVEAVTVMGFLHDIGKVALPQNILRRTGRLNGVESNLLRSHPQLGHDVLKDIEFPWPVAQAVLQHHERWNGSGYPAGLAGEAIMPEARILAVADGVEARLSPRGDRAPVGIERALAEIYQGAGTLYDPSVVEACLKVFVAKGCTSPEAAGPG